MALGPTIIQPSRIPNWDPRFDPYSIIPSHAKLKFGETFLYNGTAFCISKAEQDFLVSNWHILAGRHRVTRKPLHDCAAVPNIIRPFLVGSVEDGFQWVAVDFPLDDEDGCPLWWEHPEFQQKVDVGVLPIKFPDGLTMQPINELPTTEDMMLEIGQSVFVTGYPFNLRGGKVWPIWKRASIASEPFEDVDDLPLMLVDTAGYHGLSGAPVIAKLVDTYLSEPGLRKADMNVGTYYRFVGVYSGRRKDEQGEGSQICEVWKDRVIDEIIAGGKRADLGTG